jgi:predicted metal-binding membrane protein
VTSTVSAGDGEHGGGRVGLAPAAAAVRARLALVGFLFALAGLAWWWTADQMRGMDNGPGTDLGALGWFVGIWLVMMAAMMFPSVSPTVALYSRMTRSREPAAPLVFTAGYLLAWGATGLLAYGIFDVGHRLLGAQLSWNRGGHWAAGGTLLAAAVYEVTPLKDVCLGKCRSPLGFLLGAWRGGVSGALQMGVRHAGWCIGCCWALMAAVFALGVKSLIWMGFIAGLIAVEKTLPWGRSVTYATAGLLLLLGVVVLVAPGSLPGFTIPGGGSMGMR